MKLEQVQARKQMSIFLIITFALPFAMGALMAYGYSREMDLNVFPLAQMLYPAAGVMLAALVTRKGDPLLPKWFFIVFLILTALTILMAIASVGAPTVLPWVTVSGNVLLVGSIVLLVLLLVEEKDKLVAYGLSGKRWGAVFLICLLYLVLYAGRFAICYGIDGQLSTLGAIALDPRTWNTITYLLPGFFMVAAAFLGEEYGWRYYLQSVLQKKFGPVLGVMLVGIVWGLWHMPINFFYYTSPSLGLISVTGQVITCVTLGVFYGWAYMKTDNIWTVVILHYVNNNLVPIITGNFSADVIQNQQVSWGELPIALLVNGVVFLWVLFTSWYKDRSLRLLTMDERADAHRHVMEAQAEAVLFSQE